MVLRDPTVQGTLADPELGGIDPQVHAVLVKERSRMGLSFDPAQEPNLLLQTAARRAKVPDPAGAHIFSLAAMSTSTSLAFGTVPEAVRGGAELGRMVDRLLTGERRPQRWSAAMVPHAGLRYSGRIAADVLSRIELPGTIIVIGPKHTALGVDWAVAPHQTWLFPGGSLNSDFMLARQLSQAIPGLEMDAAAHEQEHAIEVELPLIARLAPQARVVGIVVGQGSLNSCQAFATGLADVLANRDEKPLLLISSDMNHFGTDEENRRLDSIALEAIERREPADLYETVTRNRISMCGLLPAVIVMETLRLLGGLHKVERAGYATSADVTGNTSSVVGYAGMLLD
jgi:AmmeMemoRadiSam system protein B